MVLFFEWSRRPTCFVGLKVREGGVDSGVSGEMGPIGGFWTTISRFIFFLPFFLGLLILGIIKGALLCPLTTLIITIGNFGVIIALWPVHIFWTWYCIARTKRFGPILKIILLIIITIILVLWVCIAIIGTVLGSIAYGFLAPLFSTFEAVGEGKTDVFTHCIVDGTWSTIKGSFTTVRDVSDVCLHSYFSYVNEHLLQDDPSNGKPYEIRVHLLGGIIMGLLGIIIDIPVITLVALYKTPYMLFKGWRQLFHDMIGREGPFLEMACVPFAGLAILLWPAAVIGALIASILSSFFLGGYAAIVSYQESSMTLGLYYIITSLSIFDEYSNDILDMPEGSCFPRLKYRKNQHTTPDPISRPSSFPGDKSDQKRAPSRSVSFRSAILELKPIRVLEYLFMECEMHGERLASEGIITRKDIDDCLSGKDSSKIIGIGLPAYCILQALLRSIDNNSDGLLLSDGTEITTMNRPNETFFDWFFDPLMVIKEQITTKNLETDDRDYFTKLVLLLGDLIRLKRLNAEYAVEDDRKRAEINGFARRLQGITKSIARYPTAKRRFDTLAENLSEKLSKKIGTQVGNANSIKRSRSGLGSGFVVRLFSQKSVGGGRASNRGGSSHMHDDEIQTVDSQLV